MKKLFAAPGGQIFGIVAMSFGAGAIAMLAFERLLRGDIWGWAWAALVIVFCFSISVNCVRLRKMIPAL